MQTADSGTTRGGTGKRTAIVIGCGVAGPVVAAALQKAEIEPVIYEAHPGAAEGIGAWLVIGVNGIDALRAVEMDKPVIARGFPMPRLVILNGAGKMLADFPNGGTLPDGTGAIAITRPDLHTALWDEVKARGIRIEHGKRLVHAEETGSGVRATFEDGSTAEADVLVGADGIHSTVRRLIDPAAPGPRYVGFLNTAGYARGINVPGEPLVNYLIFGKRSFFGWLTAPDGAVWWFANPPRAEDPGPQRLAETTPDEWRAELIEGFEGDAGPAQEVIRRTDHIVVSVPTYDMPTVAKWRTDRMVIIGDSAHAVSPSIGQGASMAIEDAVTLSKCLRDIPEVAPALARYEELRRDRVQRMVAQGRSNDRGKTMGEVGRFFRDIFMPIATRRMFQNGRDPFRWIWSHHIDWDEPVGRTPTSSGQRPG